MKRTVIVAGFVLLAIAVLALVVTGAKADTIIVDENGNGDYLTVQDGINNASNGDTLRVWDGAYAPFSIDKELDVVGNGTSETVIDGTGASVNVVEIYANYSSVSHMRVLTSDSARGVHTYQHHNVTILYVEAEGTGVGTATGIVVNSSAKNIAVYNCTVHEYANPAIMFSGSDVGAEIHHNYLYNITANAFRVSNNIGAQIHHNVFENCQVATAITASGNTYIYNTFRNCTTGVDITVGSGNTVTNNTFENCGKGIYAYFFSGSNLMYNNRFLNNTVHAQDDTGQVWYSGMLGNYWSGWTTPDVDYDGIVDLQYNITGAAGSVDLYPMSDEAYFEEPVANITLPETEEIVWGVPIRVSGINSDLAIWYNWTFGDGSTTNTTDVELNHTYDEPGDYMITLTVGDRYGEMDTTDAEITVGFEDTYAQADYVIVTWESLLISVMGIFLLLLVIKKTLGCFQEGMEENIREK